uniref:Fatty acyl-CoA reductase n=1 Tax=Culicoides sonorensis TaxID=179676 RepID=A0A336KKV2_CULSO
MIGITPIPEFYANKDVLITGSTGFIGKVLIEKLLRSCSQINRIFILVRSKRGKSAVDRIKEFQECPLFEKLLESNPKILDKLIPVIGDVLSLGLGLSNSDKKLMENVSIIFHSAASVRFDDPLKEAILMNTRGTREMLEFAMTLEKLKVFLHVSTTYCNADHRVIEEKIYPPHADWRKTIEIAEKLDSELLDILCPKYSDNLPNTYIFTKGLSENACDDYKTKVPICIFRPAVVVGVMREPLPGWVANFNGPAGLLVGAGSGILRAFCCDINCPLYCTPADTCVNAIIVAAWKKAQNLDKEILPIYNCATGKSSVGELTGEIMQDAAAEYPLSAAFWTVNGELTTSKTYFFFLNILFHFLPGLLIDTILKLSGRPPMLLKLQRKITAAGAALQYFVTKTFDMRCENFVNLVDCILPEDRPNFTFDVSDKHLDRRKFMFDQVKAGRIYLLKDPLSTIPAAKRKMKILNALDFTLKFIILPLILYFIFGFKIKHVFQHYFT